MVKSIAILLVALLVAAGGVALARYAEADDAPGGVIIAFLLIIGAVVVGVRVVQGMTDSRRRD